MRRFALLFSLLFLTVPSGQALAEFFPAVRDSIFSPDPMDGPTTWTNGLGGASTAHDGNTWNTPGLVLNVPETSDLAEVKIVIFGYDSDNLPENTLANILGYPMEFHVWSDCWKGNQKCCN